MTDATLKSIDTYVAKVLEEAFCTPFLASDGNQTVINTASIARDPWLEYRLPSVIQSSEDQVREAVEAGQREFATGAWSRLSKHSRRELLLVWANLLEHHAEQLALINCLETGRSIRSLVDHSLPKAVRILRWFAELTDKLEDRSVNSGEYGDDFGLIRREPIGLVAVILPWNDPLVTMAWKVAPALAMGNSIIVKPSEHATLVIREAISFAYEAGIPLGYLQMLTGDGRVGELLVRQRAVSKVAFTGSSLTALKIGSQAYGTGLKRLSMECGGKGSFIFGKKGENIDGFANVVAKNMFYNQGQICSAPSVVHIPNKYKDRFISAVLDASRAFTPRHPLSGELVGLMISKAAVSKIREELEALDTKFFAIKPSDQPTLSFPSRSLYPTVLVDLPEKHHFWDAELFAPVLLVRSYDCVSEAVYHSNKSKYGLSCGVWSRDIDECMEIAGKLRAGNIHINSWGDDPNLVPFGGIKESGFGREKSIDTLGEYSFVKSIYYKPQVP